MSIVPAPVPTATVLFTLRVDPMSRIVGMLVTEPAVTVLLAPRFATVSTNTFARPFPELCEITKFVPPARPVESVRTIICSTMRLSPCTVSVKDTAEVVIAEEVIVYFFTNRPKSLNQVAINNIWLRNKLSYTITRTCKEPSVIYDCI